MRVATRNALSISWVTMMEVAPIFSLSSMINSLMTAPMTAARMVAHDGPPVAFGTWLHSWWPGSRRSLAIDQIILLLVTMMISPQAKMETQTKIRKIFCTTPPSTSCTIRATGAELAVAADIEFAA